MIIKESIRYDDPLLDLFRDNKKILVSAIDAEQDDFRWLAGMLVKFGLSKEEIIDMFSDAVCADDVAEKMYKLLGQTKEYKLAFAESGDNDDSRLMLCDPITEEDDLFDEDEEAFVVLVCYDDENEDYRYLDNYHAESHYAELEDMSQEDYEARGIIGFALLGRSSSDERYNIVDKYIVNMENEAVVTSTIDSFIEGNDDSNLSLKGELAKTAQPDPLDGDIDESLKEDTANNLNEYIIKYEKYERFSSGGFRQATFKAKSDIAAIIKVEDRCGYGYLIDMQKSPEDFEADELEALNDKSKALDVLLNSNGDGADYVFFFKNLTTGEVFIDEDYEEDEWEDLDESLNESVDEEELKKEDFHIHSYKVIWTGKQKHYSYLGDFKVEHARYFDADKFGSQKNAYNAALQFYDKQVAKAKDFPDSYVELYSLSGRNDSKLIKDFYNETDELDEKLIQSDSEEAVRKNTQTEIEVGKDPKQAYAIAKSIQKKNMKEAYIEEPLNEGPIVQDGKVIGRDAYDGNIGDKVKDKVTGEIWTIVKHYQMGNYGYVQIERNGVIRKLKMFADKNSPRDINRYILIDKDESLKEDTVYDDPTTVIAKSIQDKYKDKELEESIQDDNLSLKGKMAKESQKNPLGEDYDEPSDYIVKVHEDGGSEVEGMDQYRADSEFDELREMSDEDLKATGLIGAAQLYRDDEGIIHSLEIVFAEGKREQVEAAVQQYVAPKDSLE